ncbi:hypothetical protein Tco_0417809 [Tanacetum coccineum]
MLVLAIYLSTLLSSSTQGRRSRATRGEDCIVEGSRWTFQEKSRVLEGVRIDLDGSVFGAAAGERGPRDTLQCQPMNEDYYEQNSCYDPNSFGFDQYQPPQFPVNYLPQETSREILQAQEDLMEAIQAFLKEYDHIPPNEKCMALLLAEERFLKIKQAMEEEQNQPEVLQELLLKLINDLQILKGILQDKKKPTEKRSKLTMKKVWGTSTIPSIENLVPIPSEFEGISDDTSDVPNCDNVESDLVESLINRDTSIVYSSKIDPILEEFAGELAHIAPIPPGIVEADFDPNDDTSSNDDSFEYIEYVDATPSYSELVNDVDQEEKEFDLEDIFQIQDVILREKLLNVHRLISNIESLKVNPTPDRVLKSPSPFPIPVADSDSFLEESDTSLSHLDNSLPEFETFSDHTEETRSGKGFISIDNSNEPLLELPEFESFHFDPSFPRPPPEPPDVEICLNFEPNAPVIDNFNELNDDQRGSEIDFSQNVEDDDSFTFVIRTFLPFLTYPEVSPLSCSTGSEDTIFDPGIST